MADYNYLTLNQTNHSLTLSAATSTANAVTIPENYKVTGVYPIGSLYFNINNINPTAYFGGTWELYSQGQVLIGVDPDDTDFNEAGKMGGENSVTLTTNQLPSHRHIITRVTNAVKGSGTLARPVLSTETSFDWGLTTESIGGDASHYNQMPYITCYVWRRVN